MNLQEECHALDVAVGWVHTVEQRSLTVIVKRCKKQKINEQENASVIIICSTIQGP